MAHIAHMMYEYETHTKYESHRRNQNYLPNYLHVITGNYLLTYLLITETRRGAAGNYGNAVILPNFPKFLPKLSEKFENITKLLTYYRAQPRSGPKNWDITRKLPKNHPFLANYLL